MKNLLSNGKTNSKTAKNSLETYILYLAPHTLNNKGINLCPWASKGCVFGCLYISGMGVFSNVQKARIEKSDYFVNDKIAFLTQLFNELEKINKKAIKENKQIAIRLNGTSDIDFVALFNHKLNKSVLDLFPNLVFYDYTKNIQKIEKYQNEQRYHLTFSRSEDTKNEDILKALNYGSNVAIVFNSDKFPTNYLNTMVLNGDESDIVMVYNKGKILGLKAKGKARKDKSGFVIQL